VQRGMQTPGVKSWQEIVSKHQIDCSSLFNQELVLQLLVGAGHNMTLSWQVLILRGSFILLAGFTFPWDRKKTWQTLGSRLILIQKLFWWEGYESNEGELLNLG
jgi:hypothetical protein